MSLGFSRSRCCVVLLCLAVSGLTVRQLHAQGTQQPRRFIELSETNTAEILTNLNQLTVKKDGLRELEDQLRSINTFSGSKSLEGRFNAPYNAPRMVPNKTIKELLERHKNWGLTSEELGTGSSTPDLDAISSFAEDGSDNKKSSVQQFYDALSRPPGSKQNLDGKSEKNASDQNRQSNSRQDDDLSSFGDDSSLPSGLRDKARSLREAVNKDPTSIFNQSRPRSSFDNFFGLNRNTPAVSSGGTKTAVDSFLEQFKKAMDGGSAVPGIDPGLQSLLPSDNAQKMPSYPTIDSLPSSKHHELTETTAGNVGSIPNHTILPDLNSTVLNQWNSLYTPPKLELPKYTPPVPPSLDFPRRKF